MSERFEIKRMGVDLTPSYRECIQNLKDMCVPYWTADRNTYTGFDGEIFESNLPMTVGIEHVGSRVNTIELLRPEGYYISEAKVDESYAEIQNELIKTYAKPDLECTFEFDNRTSVISSRWETPDLVIDHVATKGDNLNEYVHIFFRSNFDHKTGSFIANLIIPLFSGILLTFFLRLLLWKKTGYMWQSFILYAVCGIILGLLMYFGLFHEKNPRFRQYLYKKREELETEYESVFTENYIKKYNGYMMTGKNIASNMPPVTVYFFHDHILFVSIRHKDIVELEKPFSEAGCLFAEGKIMTTIFANKEFVAFILDDSNQIVDLLKEFQAGKERNTKSGDNS